MPCCDDDSYRWHEANSEIKRLKQVACDMAKVLTRGGGIEDLTQASKDWIRKHNQEDERRRDREEERRMLLEHRERLLKVLSPQDLRALGLV